MPSVSSLPPTVFFNVGWMQRCAGLRGDSLTGGGEWPAEWSAELTPNELAHRGSRSARPSCASSRALWMPDAGTFACSSHAEPRAGAVHWLDQDDRVLAIQELKGARVRCP